MLIVTRSIGEGVMIGNEIKITFLRIRGKKIRMGIQAPSQFKITQLTEQVSFDATKPSGWEVVEFQDFNESVDS
ncbi:MAG: carbon storage regulator [Pseudomonadota bacterium]|nr:carbon storage regulator [Gammaproteobacteria bacterium]MBU1628792.1 carbon storage regulator [Gammaproteobacteria bacterium]MBU1927247.1 carbon storage regulator [Gammaproteobacteria bacterium]MBU2545703.1 carbon storage regulator [Gammaproteobacteria bacterium]